MPRLVGIGARSNLKDKTNRLLLDNALRLLVDARVLFDAGRFPSSLALAVLSLEEFGKFARRFSDGFIGQKSSAEKRLHRQKQLTVSQFLFRLSYCRAVAAKLKVEIHFTPTTILVRPNGPIDRERVERALTRVSLDDWSADEFADIWLDNELMKKAHWLDTVVKRGELEKWRNAALYFDPKPGRKAQAPVEAIKARTAYKVLSVCETLLAHLEHIFEDEHAFA